jgi:endogenous inhibitor of DNA gyrase (YacG/DUF329 family)
MSTIVCPVCGACFEPEISASLPFCSPRCRHIDLSRWLSEEYGLPIEDAEPDEVDDVAENRDKDDWPG